MSAIRSERRRVLLVDDNFATRELVSMVLGCQGYAVATAAHGAEAIEKLRSSQSPPPDVIILDLCMPVMDGWALYEELRRDEKLAGVPVVVMSGLSECDQQSPSLKDVPFLQKPIETAELLQALKGCCAEQTRECAAKADAGVSFAG